MEVKDGVGECARRTGGGRDAGQETASADASVPGV